MLQNNIDPYVGDVVHEIPIVLMFLSEAIKLSERCLPIFMTVTELITAFALFKFSQNVISNSLLMQHKLKNTYNSTTKKIQWQFNDVVDLPCIVLYFYLFNPMLIINCIGMTTTVFSNCILALTLYFLSCKSFFRCIFLLALETIRNFYSFVLLAPLIIVFVKEKLLRSLLAITICFLSVCSILVLCNCFIMESCNFLNGNFGFM